MSATVPGAGTPAGTVEFFDGATRLGSEALDDGSASLPISSLSVGSHAITASYTNTDGNFMNGTSATLSQGVDQDSTSTALTSSGNSSAFGQLVTFTATVTANAPGSGLPNGVVTFYDGPVNPADQIGTGTLSISGGVMTATLSTAGVPVGNDTITATYSGDGNFLASAGTFTITINQSIIVLDQSAGGALSLTGNASINVSGVVYVDSSSTSALSASGNAQITAYAIDVVGGVKRSGTARFNPGPTTGAKTLADPLSGLALPDTSGMPNYGTENLGGNSSATIQPGIYSQISASGNAKLTLSSGVYIVEGGGFSVSGNATVTGSGVMIVNVGGNYPSSGGSYGGISLSGNGSYSLSPQSSGTYAGIVIFQPKDNTKGLSVSGNASGMTGAIYAPAARLNESGNARLNAAIVVDTMTVSGNAIEQIPVRGAAGPGMATKNHGIPAAQAARATSARSSAGLIALDLVLADAGTTAGVTASGVNPTAAVGHVAQKAGKGSTVHNVTTSAPPTIDPGAVDALLLEGLSLGFPPDRAPPRPANSEIRDGRGRNRLNTMPGYFVGKARLTAKHTSLLRSLETR